MTQREQLVNLLINAGVQYEETHGGATDTVTVHDFPSGSGTAVWVFNAVDGTLTGLTH